MTKVIDAEVVEMVVGDLITVQQAPIVKYEMLKDFSVRIQTQLQKLDLENIIANEENLKEIKSTRTEIRKDLKEFEDSRKNTEQMILKPYKKFESEYNKLIKKPLTYADKLLKKKVDEVENDLRKQKTDFFKSLFKKRILEEEVYFLKFEQMGLNIQLSTSEKALKDEIEDFIIKVKKDLEVIELDENKNRVLVEYHKHLDLSKAIVDVKNAIELEKQIEIRQNEASKKIVEPKAEDVNIKREEVKEVAEVFEIVFKVKGTKEELIAVRTFMQERGIEYV